MVVSTPITLLMVLGLIFQPSEDIVLYQGPSNGYTSRFLGCYVYVSNTTNRLDGYLCFHDTNYTRATIPAVIDIPCPVHGQFVIYYNERPQNSPYKTRYSNYAHTELCEVEVNGCKKTGVYGQDCFLPCPDTNCRYCHIETGACHGCKPGYKGHHCELQCDKDTYGQNCGHKCGACLGYKQCYHINGSCLEGCDAGYEGTFCNNECDGGFHGKNCSLPCGHCLKSALCHPLNGSCLNGCDAGYQGSYCNKTCSNGWFGMDCLKQCGYCKGNVPCSHVTGSCFGVCDSGYSGEKCTDNVSSLLLAIQSEMLNLMREFMYYKRRESQLRRNFTSPTDFIKKLFAK